MNYSDILLFIFLQFFSLFILISGILMLSKELKKREKKNKSRLIASIIVILGGLLYFIKHIIEL